MKYKHILNFLAGTVAALIVISLKAHAGTAESEWGDMGYAHPDPEVTPLTAGDTPGDAAIDGSQSSADKPVEKSTEKKQLDNEEIATQMSSAEMDTSQPSKANQKDLTDISTVQNTYGVQTEERSTVSFYAAPFAGASGMLGNNSASSSPVFAAGASVGLLLSQYFLVDATFTRSETNFSNPVVNSTGVNLLGGGNVYLLTQNMISGGGRFFILGRESRIRPFIGGGAGYSSGTLDYTQAYATALGNQSQYLNEVNVNEVLGYGEVGAEIAITRNIVASASFQLSGVLSSSVNGNSADATRLNVANSVGQTASYLVVGGVGFYF